jgi:hypothetical protein
MKKKKKNNTEFETPELDAWLKELEWEIRMDELKKQLPFYLFGLALIIVFLGFAYPPLLFFGSVSLIGLGTYFFIYYLLQGLEAEPPKKVSSYETNIVHNHHHHHYAPKSLTEVREVSARLPNGTELRVRQGRKYE